MTEPLPLPTPVPDQITREDLRAVLTGVPEGPYTTRDLHPRYAAWCEQQGRKPGSVKALGEAIARHFDFERRSRHGNVAIWHLTERGLNHQDWHTGPV